MPQGNTETDPFDRLYARWAKQAERQHLDPPSRERWDVIVLRLILSEDPDRVRRYRSIEADGPDTLGADAYELWDKMPDYTPNLSVPWEGLAAYEEAHRGSMRRLMEGQGLLDRYNAIVAAQREGQRVLTPEERARARRAQQQVIIIGCAGMGLIALMVLTVLLLIALGPL